MRRYILQIQASISADGWNGSVGLPTLILEAASVEEAHRKVADIMKHLPVGSAYALAEGDYYLCCHAPTDMGHSFGCPHSPENMSETEARMDNYNEYQRDLPPCVRGPG